MKEEISNYGYTASDLVNAWLSPLALRG
jgi:hypothetical protein